MKPEQIEVVGEFLAIRWSDGRESVIPLEDLRRACPCARCAGEPDLTGGIRRMPPLPLTERSFQVVGWEPVGSYAVALRWGDGHDTGIYTYDALLRLGDEAEPDTP